MSEALRVVTWNIHKGIGTDRRYGIDRTIDVLQSIDADVVCLQEVDENVSRSRFDRQAHLLARELGYDDVAIGLNVAVRGGHYGNCTLSRRAIRGWKNVDLTVPYKKRRSGLVTRIKGGHGRDWVVANVHLGLLHIERRAQVHRLFAHILEEADGDDAVLVAGDWNDWGNRLHRAVAEGEGFRVARNVGHRKGGPRTFPSRRPIFALDKILYRPPVEVVEVIPLRDERTRRASDHLPLVADLRLPAREREPAKERNPPPD